MTDPRSVCRKRAENLMPGVPYVRGWADGKRGADALATVLRELGLDSDFPGLKADVNVSGDGVVCLGTIRPDAAKLLASLLVLKPHDGDGESNSSPCHAYRVVECPRRGREPGRPGAVMRSDDRARFWCELSATPPDQSSRIVLGSYRAPTPRLAVRWMRGQAERVARALDPDPGASWLPPGCAHVTSPGTLNPGRVMREWARSPHEEEDALAMLSEGWPYTLAACDETACYALTAGPLALSATTTFRAYQRAYAAA
ncbi:hypothetical protein LUW77_21810 [Streptomyces radiopugnans]|nr:hypothetical protein LUW77_21810 [Streptomyces radiopugnans]